MARYRFSTLLLPSLTVLYASASDPVASFGKMTEICAIGLEDIFFRNLFRLRLRSLTNVFGHLVLVPEPPDNQEKQTVLYPISFHH